MRNDSIQMLQKASAIVTDHIPEPWKEVHVEAEIDHELADFCVWYVDANGNEETLAVVPGELMDCFVGLRKITGDEEKGLWTKCLFTLSCDGQFKTDFSYEPPRWAT